MKATFVRRKLQSGIVWAVACGMGGDVSFQVTFIKSYV